MAQPQPAPPAVELVAIFSRHTCALQWARDRITEQFGELELTSALFDHRETAYYESEMGAGLKKQFLVVRGVYDPVRLADRKLTSNALEAELARAKRYDEPRPVNIDPGYLTLTKLVLASAKDRAHRIYLRDGIYAEECLYFLGGCWHARPWTYPDYQRNDFQDFFSRTRDYLKSLLKDKPVLGRESGEPQLPDS